LFAILTFPRDAISPRLREKLHVPALEQHLTIIVRSIRAFLNLEAGVTRGGDAPLPLRADLIQQLEEARQELESRDRMLAELRARPVTRDDTEIRGINPENIVWIFGSGRTGSTWLSSMMGDMEGHALWGEPWVGTLFGNYYYRGVDERRRNSKQFIMGRYKETWLGAIRNFVLDMARTIFPALSEDEYLIIKEPNGSVGAPLMMEALPESRMILLVRDPRDVVASSMDGKSEGGWNYEKNKQLYLEGRKRSSSENPDNFAKQRARRFLEGMGKAKEAYDAHKGLKVLVRYEELRADTLGTMKRMYSTLGIDVDERNLAQVIEKHSWGSIPEDQKGQGKFYRKATPGSWREDLTPEQVRIVQETTRPLLERFYSYEAQGEKLPEKSPLS
jgi:Sulfotransferase family